MSSDRLRALEAEALQIIDSALEDSNSPCATCSFQIGGVVMLHMLIRRRADVPVLFLDTVHHFAETYEYRDRIARAWQLNVVTLRANQPVAGLWRTSTDACCEHHKVAPLFTALEAHDAWLSGLRREQSPTRAALATVDSFVLPSGRTLTKVSPLARWTMDDVTMYAERHEIPVHPLYELGYTSIGCEPCTTVPLDVLNPRSGRWRGQKLECGIHVNRFAHGPV